MSKIFRRCSCRVDVLDAEGNATFDSAGKKKTIQLGSKCPKLKGSRHGSYSYRVSAGFDPITGKRRYLSESGIDSAKEAESRKAIAEKSVRTGTAKFDKMTMEAYLRNWFESAVARESIKPTTAKMYGRYLELDIIPALGPVLLVGLRKHHVAGFIEDLEKAKRGATTIRRIHATLRSALTDALERDLIDYNPASHVRLPSVTKARISPWEPDEAGIFLDVAAEHRLGALFEVAILTGLRRGELAGLRWSDIDFDRDRLTVSVQLVRVGTKTMEQSIKTEAGQHRVVPLDGRARGALIAWQFVQADDRATYASVGAEYTESGRVFTMDDGAHLRPEYASRLFDQLQAKTSLRRMRFHDLRHLFASLALSNGEDMGVVSKIMGHSGSQITRDLYGHLVGDRALLTMRGVASLLDSGKQSARSAVLTSAITRKEKAPLVTFERALTGLAS